MELAFANGDSSGSLFMLSPGKLGKQMDRIIALSGVVFLVGLLLGWYLHYIQQLSAANWMIAMTLITLALVNLYFFLFHIRNTHKNVWLWLDSEEILIMADEDILYREKIEDLTISSSGKGERKSSFYIRGKNTPGIYLGLHPPTSRKTYTREISPEYYILDSPKDWDRLNNLLINEEE
jgi:hypothetical protein